MTARSIIEAEALHTYYGASHILHGINFLVRRGEAIGLMGRNGMGKLHGAVLGAFAYTVLQEILSTPLLLGSYAKHWQLAMGSLIVCIVLAFPHGLAGILDLSLRIRSSKPSRVEEALDD